MELLVVVLMNETQLSISSSIRTNSSDVLLRKVSIVRMQKSLAGLFTDRTAIDTSLRRFFNEDNLKQTFAYNDCLKLNDEDTINFYNSTKQSSDRLIDESHNLFIPFEDGDSVE